MIVEEVERALLHACRRGHAEVVDFTVAPRSPSSAQVRGGHDWLIEFAEPPPAPETFVQALDEALQGTGDLGMGAPRVFELPAGTFYRWMRERGELGDQHKVPRVTNDRAIADGLLTVANLASRPPSRKVYSPVILL